MPAGNTAGNFVACRLSGLWACGAGDGTPWTTWEMPESREAAPGLHPSPALLPPCWQGFFKGAAGKVPNSEFDPISLEIPTYGFFFYFPSFALGCEDLQGAWLKPVSLGALSPHTIAQRREFSQEIPLSPSLFPLLQVSKELPLEIRSPFKFRCRHYLEFGFINYLHLVPINKVEQYSCPDFSIGLEEKHRICGFSLSP